MRYKSKNDRRLVLVAAALLTVLLRFPGALAAGASDPATFTLATRLADSTFDPALHRAELDGMDIINLYDPLVMPAAGGVLRPHLATSWEASADARVWTLKLRDGVTFHDGKRLTAADVVYSMDRMLTIQQGHAYLWGGLLQVGATRALDDRTVEFTLDKPYGPFIQTLVQLFVVNSTLLSANTYPDGPYREHGDYGTAYLQNHDAGSGPYMLEHVLPGTRRSFVRFDGYWQGWSSNQFKHVVVEVAGDAASAREALMTGDVDMVDQWQTPSFFRTVAQTPRVRIAEEPDSALYLVHMNTARPPLDDVNFRKAVSQAFDYATALEIVGGTATHGPIPTMMPGFDGVPAGATDQVQARALLAQSRYRPGDYPLEYAFLDTAVNQKLGELLRASLAPLGIMVRLKPEQWPTLAARVAKRATSPHFFPIINATNVPTPDHYLFGMYHPASHGGWQAASHYSNNAVTGLIEEARRMADGAERNSLYAQAARLIVDDAAGLWIGSPLHRIALAKRIRNYRYFGLPCFDLRFYDLAYE